MKNNLASAETAIFKAENLIKNSQSYAFRADDPEDNQRALRAVHEAAEHQVIALRELHSAPFDLGKSSRDLFRFGEVALNGCGGAARSSELPKESPGLRFYARLRGHE